MYLEEAQSVGQNGETCLKSSLHIDIEKSKTVNKFFIEKRDDSAIRDLFSQNCLHLYNGEFTVLKHDEKDTISVLSDNVASNVSLFLSPIDTWFSKSV